METVDLIISVVGFSVLVLIILGMRTRLKTQGKMLDEHNKMLEGAKVFLEFANPEKLKETAEAIVALKEERIKEESEKKLRDFQKISASLFE
jgi:phosphoenolpyruvate synthase/pyruvate phosphate dikinase